MSAKALRERVGTMLAFLERYKKDSVASSSGKGMTENENTHEILRRLSAICAHKNSTFPNEVKDAREKSDALLVQSLSQLTKSLVDAESFCRRFNAAYKEDERNASEDVKSNDLLGGRSFVAFGGGGGAGRSSSGGFNPRNRRGERGPVRDPPLVSPDAVGEQRGGHRGRRADGTSPGGRSRASLPVPPSGGMQID